MMLSFVCVSNYIYHHNERNYNAGTGNYPYVAEYTLLYKYDSKFC